MPTNTTKPKFNRDAYFHRVQVTEALCHALESEVAAHSNEDWRVQFTSQFWFRVIDRTNPKKPRDFGWYENMDEVIEKFRKEFPNMDLATYHNA